MKTNKDNNIKKSVIFVFVIIFVVALMGIAAYFILVDNDTKEEKTADKKLDEIVGYNIHLSENDSEEYKSVYNHLKENLESGDINYDEYATDIAKLFIIDLYTMDTKLNKYDVGGSEFVYPDKKDNYVLNVTNTLYNYLEDNSDNKRDQKLPHVSSVNITKTSNKEYKINGIEQVFNAYIFNVEVSYKVDLGYDKSAEVIVINKDNFMYVVEKN